MFKCEATGKVAQRGVSPVMCYNYTEDYQHECLVVRYNSETREREAFNRAGIGRQIRAQMRVMPDEKALRIAEERGFTPVGGTEAAIESIAREINRAMMQGHEQRAGGDRDKPPAAVGQHPRQ